MTRSSAFIERDTLILRVFWMIVFFLVWQVAEVLLLCLVLIQLGLRAFQNHPSPELSQLGDSLSQYLAQIGRFATFSTDQKPWPFTEWPQAYPVESEVILASAVGEEREKER